MYIQTINNGSMASGFYKKYLYPKNVPSKFRGKVNKISQYKFNNDDDFFNQLKYIVLNQLKGKQMIKNGKIILTSKSFY